MESSSSSKGDGESGIALFSETGVTVASAHPAAAEYRKSLRFIVADLPRLVTDMPQAKPCDISLSGVIEEFRS